LPALLPAGAQKTLRHLTNLPTCCRFVLCSCQRGTHPTAAARWTFSWTFASLFIGAFSKYCQTSAEVSSCSLMVDGESRRWSASEPLGQNGYACVAR
jgi:hypothetical protein